jgi:hypothetical protein
VVEVGFSAWWWSCPGAWGADLGPLRGVSGHSWRALGQLGHSPLRDTQGVAVGGVAEDGQGDLLGNGGLGAFSFSWQSLLVPRMKLFDIQ